MYMLKFVCTYASVEYSIPVIFDNPLKVLHSSSGKSGFFCHSQISLACHKLATSHRFNHWSLWAMASFFFLVVEELLPLSLALSLSCFLFLPLFFLLSCHFFSSCFFFFFSSHFYFFSSCFFFGGMARISNDDSMRSDPFCLFHMQNILTFLRNLYNTLHEN